MKHYERANYESNTWSKVLMYLIGIDLKPVSNFISGLSELE